MTMHELARSEIRKAFAAKRKELEAKLSRLEQRREDGWGYRKVRRKAHRVPAHGALGHRSGETVSWWRQWCGMWYRIGWILDYDRRYGQDAFRIQYGKCPTCRQHHFRHLDWCPSYPGGPL